MEVLKHICTFVIIRRNIKTKGKSFPVVILGEIYIIMRINLVVNENNLFVT